MERGEFDGGESLSEAFGGVVGSFVGCGLCVGEVVCEQISPTPTYDCYVNYGEGTPPFAILPFCAELRDGTVYMNSAREGCGPSSQGHLFQRAAPDDFG